jgi:hypothetical protein
MIATTKRIAAIGTMIALVVLSGCASFDATLAVDDEGNSMPTSHQASNDILKQMDRDSQAGGE